MKDIIKGFLIGLANIIPGVSGGTFALILGIYDKLISALAGFDSRFFIEIVRKKNIINPFLERDGVFLFKIMGGAVLSIAVASHFIEYSLYNYTSITLAFFAGLIIPSISIPVKMVKRKGLFEFISLFSGIVAVLTISYIIPTVSSDKISYFYIFICGVIAISAMILPGISGSFMLLVLGIYEYIISSIKQLTSSFNSQSVIVLFVFASGCLIGLILFARLMRYLLSKHKSITVSFLIGLVIGSLVVLWPFKDIPASVEFSDSIIISAKNRLPVDLYECGKVLLGFIPGFILSFLLVRIEKKAVSIKIIENEKGEL